MLNTSDTNIASFVTKIFGLKELFDCDRVAEALNQTDSSRGQNAG
jgi:hypothetical protein